MAWAHLKHWWNGGSEDGSNENDDATFCQDASEPEQVPGATDATRVLKMKSVFFMSPLMRPTPKY